MRLLVLLLVVSVCSAQTLVLTAKAGLSASTLLTLQHGGGVAAAWRCGETVPWPALRLPAGAPGEEGVRFAILAGPLQPSDAEVTLVPSEEAETPRWSCSSVDGEREVRWNDKLFLRSATRFDPAHLEETFKAFEHLFAADGVARLTKGAGGKHSHHRGLFLGWNDVRHAGKTLDFWHGKDGVSIRHKRFREDLEVFGAAGARFALENEWCLADGTPLVQELRVLTAFRCGEARALDIAVGLRSLQGSVSLHGDAHHAGLHVRAADEVAEHEATTRVLLTAGAKALGNDLHTGADWCCESFSIGGKTMAFLLINHPSNPESVLSARAYGRLGFMPELELDAAAMRVLRWRLVVFDSVAPDPAACDKLAALYRQPATLTWR